MLQSLHRKSQTTPRDDKIPRNSTANKNTRQTNMAAGKTAPFAEEKRYPIAEEKAPRTNQAERRILWICGAIVLAAAVAVTVLLFCIRAARDRVAPESVVAVYGEYELTNAELGYYYWNEYFFLLDQTTTEAFDSTRPLREQMYNDEITWEAYLINNALETVQQTMALVFAAQEAGFVLPETYQESLDTRIDELDDDAASGGFTDEQGNGDVAAYLVYTYGQGAARETFEQYMRNTYLASAYSDARYDEPTFSAQELSDYFDSYAQEYATQYGISKEELYPVDVWCAFFEEEDDAMAFEDSWTEDPTQDNFIALIDSAADGDGEFYQDVTPDSTEENISDWCFAQGRAQGDCARLEASGGWVMIYLSGISTQTYWEMNAEADLRYETYISTLRALCDGYEFIIYTQRISIGEPTDLYESVE